MPWDSGRATIRLSRLFFHHRPPICAMPRANSHYPRTTMGKNYKLCEFTKKDDDTDVATPDNYAFFHPCEYAEIFGTPKKSATGQDIYGYVKICAIDKNGSNHRCIRLKYHGRLIEKDKIALTYHNRCRLGLADMRKDEMVMVRVKKSNWLAYYWFNGDSGVCWTLRFSISSLILSLISLFK